MVEYGRKTGFVRLIVRLEPIGPVPVIIGRGLLLLIGEAARGPANEAVFINSGGQYATTYYAGDLKVQGELAFGQGVPLTCNVRPLGSGCTRASKTLTDGLSPANDVTTVYAKGHGIWGNAIRITVADGTYNGIEVNSGFSGDATVGPYYTLNHDLVQSSSNYVKVDGVAKTIVYTIGELSAGKVFVDTTNGSLTFYTGEGPTTTQTIEYNIRYKSRKITITDNESTKVYDRIFDLEGLVAALSESDLVYAEDVVTETHLPANGTWALTGGLNGSALTTTDWSTAIDIGYAACANYLGAPTCVALTACEVAAGSYDLIPIMDLKSVEYANKHRPALWFVGLPENTAIATALNVASSYSNRLLYIVANPWDNSTSPEPRKNGAVARAGQEAALELGGSGALRRNAIRGMNGLLNEISDDDADALTQSTQAHCDCLLKKSGGIKPYVGISTDATWQFMRSVDNKTLNYIHISAAFISDAFFHEKNTPEVRTAFKNSLKALLDDCLSNLKIIDKYTLEVLSDIERGGADTGKVHALINLTVTGHIERIDMPIGVGVF